MAVQWQGFESHSRQLADYADWVVTEGIYGLSWEIVKHWIGNRMLGVI